jgi:formate dehydrogenase maturation protein FdhE
MNDAERAIEDLKDINTILKTQHMCKVLDDELTKKDVEDYKSRFASVNLAISALEKQIPKKVTYDYGLNETRCPECKTIFGYAEEGEDDEYYTPYCYECGQCLDWEVENE